MADIDKVKYHSLQVWRKYRVNLCGYRVVDSEGETLEKQAKQYLYLPIKETMDIFDRVFLEDKVDTQWKTEQIDQIIKIAESLLNIVIRTDFDLSQISFLLLVDVNTKEFKINIIDFPYVRVGVVGR